ncbi:MAG: hypothetical protein CMM52_09635 [Rhodospirillaceae bacterium]|nr:hypothetical protein [Rhodospirillaceae bacterium]|tara:strand:- start:15901 stop:16716 length:816 start_codon:yes stop_codon:yes gene_type:complete
MSGRAIEVDGNQVWIIEEGNGGPVIYLHGFADVPGLAGDVPPLQMELAKDFQIIAPAHPACSKSDEREDLDNMEDLVFHYLDVFEALDLDTFHLVGSCLGGWVAAEIASRYPERIRSLSLIGATGLFVKGHPVADIFWVAQPEDGLYYNDLRNILFSSKDSEIGNELFPDGRGELDRELLRYGMFRFASRFGFSPPYLHNRKLRSRLRRYKGPALVIWGENDHLVPREHATAYSDELNNAPIEIISESGHSVQVEAVADAAALILKFLSKN